MRYAFILLLMTACSLFEVPPDPTINTPTITNQQFKEFLMVPAREFSFGSIKRFTVSYDEVRDLLLVSEAIGNTSTSLKLIEALSLTQGLFQVVSDTDDLRVGGYVVVELIHDPNGNKNLVMMFMPRAVFSTINQAINDFTTNKDTNYRIR